MEYHFARLIIWRSLGFFFKSEGLARLDKSQALAGPLDKHPEEGCLFSLYSHVSHLRPAVPWFLPFSQRVSQARQISSPGWSTQIIKQLSQKLNCFFFY